MSDRKDKSQMSGENKKKKANFYSGILQLGRRNPSFFPGIPLEYFIPGKRKKSYFFFFAWA